MQGQQYTKRRVLHAEYPYSCNGTVKQCVFPPAHALTNAHVLQIFVAFQEHNLEAVEAFCELAPRYFDAKDVKRRKLQRLCEQHYAPDMHIVQLRLRPEGEKARPLHMEFVRLAGLFDASDADEGSSGSDSDDGPL